MGSAAGGRRLSRLAWTGLHGAGTGRQQRAAGLGRPHRLAARADPIGELADAFSRAGVEDAAVADDTTSRERLWTLREAHAEAISAAGVPHKLDIGVPLTALPRFLEELPAVVSEVAPEARLFVWGHLGDGNLHVNLLGLEPDDERPDEVVLRLALDCGGTISAEHGVGTAKAHWLVEGRGADEVAAMRRVKGALDAAGVLNRGVVLPDPLGASGGTWSTPADRPLEPLDRSA